MVKYFLQVVKNCPKITIAANFFANKTDPFRCWEYYTYNRPTFRQVELRPYS